MNQSMSNRRLAENEAYFRNHNEQVEKELAAIRQVAEEEGKHELIPNERHTVFHFYCECSDENCRQRIGLVLEDYSNIHLDREKFVIKPGHQVGSIEKIVAKTPGYWIVKKLVPVPEKVNRLQSTPIQNT